VRHACAAGAAVFVFVFVFCDCTALSLYALLPCNLSTLFKPPSHSPAHQHPPLTTTPHPQHQQQVRLLKEHIDTLRARMPPGNALIGPSTPPAARASTGEPSSGAAVSSLAADFMGKAPLFEDDADFIAEVAQGASFAPGMDPQSELDLLRKKYDVWNKAFKERLRMAQTALRTAQARSRGGAAAAAGIDLASMPDLAAPGLLGEEVQPGTARSGDSWDGTGAGAAGGGAAAAPGAAGGSSGGKKKKGLFGR